MLVRGLYAVAEVYRPGAGYVAIVAWIDSGGMVQHRHGVLRLHDVDRQLSGKRGGRYVAEILQRRDRPRVADDLRLGVIIVSSGNSAGGLVHAMSDEKAFLAKCEPLREVLVMYLARLPDFAFCDSRSLSWIYDQHTLVVSICYRERRPLKTDKNRMLGIVSIVHGERACAI